MKPLINKISQYLIRKRFYHLLDFYKMHLAKDLCLQLYEALMLPVFLIRFAFGFQFSLRYDEREEGLCIFPADIGEEEVERMSAQHMKAQYSIAGQALTYGSLLL